MKSIEFEQFVGVGGAARTRTPGRLRRAEGAPKGIQQVEGVLLQQAPVREAARVTTVPAEPEKWWKRRRGRTSGRMLRKRFLARESPYVESTPARESAQEALRETEFAGGGMTEPEECQRQIDRRIKRRERRS